MNGKLILLIGKSGVGKSSIEEILWKLNYNRVISYTTRIPRNGEIEGVDYINISNEEFIEKINNNEILEFTERYGNYYGIGINSIDLSKGDFVCSVDPEGYYNLKKHFGDAVVAIYLYIDDYERMIRLLNREKDVQKASDRFYSDNKVFDDAEKDILYKVPNIDVKSTAITINTLIIKSIRVNDNLNQID